MRAEILKLLNGEKSSSTPAFSGLIHVTAERLKSEGLSLKEVHHDAHSPEHIAECDYTIVANQQDCLQQFPFELSNYPYTQQAFPFLQQLLQLSLQHHKQLYVSVLWLQAYSILWLRTFSVTKRILFVRSDTQF